MKKRLLTFAVIFAFAAILVAVFAFSASAASPTCSVTGGNHFAGDAATCETPCLCEACGDVLTPALGHKPGAPATCGSAQECTICGDELNPALGDEFCIGNREHSDCTNDKRCKLCNRLMEAKTGHTVAEDAHADCGHAVMCQTCFDTVEEVQGEHTFDWANAVTVREATETSPKLVNVKCTTCERVFERVYVNTTTDSEGLGSVDVGEGESTSEVVGATLKVETLKRADYADTDIAKKYEMLQTFKLTMEKNGVAVAPSAARTVTMTLNKAAAEVENIKVFAMKDDGSYEEMNVVSTENGKVRFETAYLAGTQFAIVDAEPKAEPTPTPTPGDSTSTSEPTTEPEAPNYVLIAIIAGSAVAVVVVVVVLAVILKKKKSQAAE